MHKAGARIFLLGCKKPGLHENFTRSNRYRVRTKEKSKQRTGDSPQNENNLKGRQCERDWHLSRGPLQLRYRSPAVIAK
jgi:hypothetical protein